MKNCINFCVKHWSAILVITLLSIIVILFIIYGFVISMIYTAVLASAFMLFVIYEVFPWKGRDFFYNLNGVFRVHDIVYDRGSATRPTVPGILKYDKKEGWFMVYDDGFEWPLSEFKNIELFIYQQKKK